MDTFTLLLTALLSLYSASAFSLADATQSIPSMAPTPIESSAFTGVDMSSLIGAGNLIAPQEEPPPDFSLENSCILPGHDVNLCSPVEEDVIDFGGVSSDESCREGETLGGNGCCYNVVLTLGIMCSEGERVVYTCDNNVGVPRCSDSESGDTPEVAEADPPTARPTFTPSKAQCRSNGYNLSYADCSGIKGIDDGIRLRMQQEFAAKKVRCEQHISKGLNRDCKTVSGGNSPGGNTSASAGELSCQASEQLNASLSEARTRVQTCQGKLGSCSSICNIRVGGPEPFFSALTEERSPQCTSQLEPAYATAKNSLEGMVSTAQAETSRCQALKDSPDEDPTQNNFLSQPQSFAGASRGSSFGSYKGTSGSELGSSSGYSTGKAFGETAKNVYNNLTGKSSSPSGNLGSNVSGIPEDRIIGNGSNRGSYASAGGASGRAGSGKATSAGSFGSSGGSKSKVGANAKKRRYKTAKSRNLARGFKSVKASDGGAGVSIKSSDFKRFGSKGLKSKLAEARKLHGKDLPLIFKNGKFVLDFLAMKESSKFKARTSAMESYLKGGQRKTASVSDLHVHQNPKLNIFKIMNFRYQRQSFNKIGE